MVWGANHAILDGFTVRGGLGLGNGMNSFGAGLCCDHVSLEVRSCMFESNSGQYGAAIGAQVSSLSIFDSTFQENASSIRGAVRATLSVVVIDNCLFGFNAFIPATSGGGAVSLSSNTAATIRNSAFVGNAGGGAAGLSVGGGDMTVEGCTFWSNYGGAMSIGGCDATIRDCVFVGNSAT